MCRDSVLGTMRDLRVTLLNRKMIMGHNDPIILVQPTFPGKQPTDRLVSLQSKTQAILRIPRVFPRATQHGKL